MTCCHSDSSEKPSAHTDVKNSKGINNNNAKKYKRSIKLCMTGWERRATGDCGKRLKFDYITKWYIQKLKCFRKNETSKIPRDFEIKRTTHIVSHPFSDWLIRKRVWHYVGGPLSRRSLCLFWRETKQRPELETSTWPEVGKGTRERSWKKEPREGSWRRATERDSWQSTPDSRRDESAWDSVQKQWGKASQDELAFLVAL